MKKLLVVASITIAFVFTNCSNENLNESDNQNSVDVYVTGHKDYNACYWKNNTLVILDNNISNFSTANKICVENNNTYILGKDDPFLIFGSNHFLWKNGDQIDLNSEFQEPDHEVWIITDMLIDGTDEYFLGYLKNTSDNSIPQTYDLVYWKNGIKTIILENTTWEISDSKIWIVNDNIYVWSHNTNNQVGIFINNSFTPFNSNNYTTFGLTTNESEVYTYGKVVGENTGFYKNLNTGTVINTEEIIIDLRIDSNDIYTLTTEFDPLESPFYTIKKNNTHHYTYTSPVDILDTRFLGFQVLGGNVYFLMRDQVGNYGPNKLFINEELTLVLDDIPHIENILTSLYVVDN